MDKRKTTPNINPYSKVFGHAAFKSSTSSSVNQLLGFTVYYDAGENRVSKKDLLDKIVELSPSPHSIYPDEEGYLLRFELDNPFDIENDEQENELREKILNFLEENKVVKGKLQEMEMGKWAILLDDGEVAE